MSAPDPAPVHVRNPEEDLFNFDDLLMDAFGSLEQEPGKEPRGALPERKSAPAPRPVVTAPARPRVLQDAQEPAAAPAAASAPAAPMAQAPIVVQAPAVTVPPTTVVVQPAPQSSSLQQLALGAFLLVNVVFGVLCWRSLATVRSLVVEQGAASAPEDVPPQPVEAPDAVAGPASVAAEPELPFEPPLQLDEAGAGLALALEALEQERFDLARQRLFGLLAVIDRYDERVRPDLEARASFLLGDCWRREAEAAERALASAAESALAGAEVAQ